MLSPKEIYYKELEVLFSDDHEIKINIDRETDTVKLLVDSEEKATALAYLLPKEKTFGTETVKVYVIPANSKSCLEASFRKAFAGNPAFVDAYGIDGLFDVHYCIFAHAVVQYYSDNMGDPCGNTTTLYQDIAKNVFDDKLAVFYCTEEIAKE